MGPRSEPSPSAGGGVHFWLLSQANRCRLGGLEPGTTHRVLQESTSNCGRRVPDREIEDAVRKAFASNWTPGPVRPRADRPLRPPPSSWPEPDAARIAAAEATGWGLADLWEASPVRLDDNAPHAEAIIEALFPGDPLLCVAASQPADARTAPRSAWRGQFASSALIVPSPMAALTGMTQEGKLSPRCLANTGPRRFLVAEFDSGDLDRQAARLLHLGQFAPLVVAVHSGGKSLHGWFLVAGQTEDKIRKFFRYAVALGADPATWTPCQMVRLPDGTRDNGRRQTVFFLSLHPLQTHVHAPA